MLGFDSVIFSLTLYKAFTIGRGVRLLNVIVRDGASSLVIIPWAMSLIIRVRHHVLLVRVILFFGPLKNLKDPRQGAVLHESRKYYDPSGTSRFVYQNLSFDLPIFLVCPSSLSCTLTDARALFYFILNAAFAKNFYHNIYERVRFVSILSLSAIFLDPHPN